jgi:DNA-directed RNA polymerase specialized sigma24 family protein
MSISQELFSSSSVSFNERAKQSSIELCRDIYEGNRHRVYSLAFYMTDSELTAEDLMANTFCRAFSQEKRPNAEVIDQALVQEVRELMPLGTLTLESVPVNQQQQVRNQNNHRVELERAVIQLPPTERMIFLMADVESYDHARIARTLDISEAESRRGLFQARLKLRELLAQQRSQSKEAAA